MNARRPVRPGRDAPRWLSSGKSAWASKLAARTGQYVRVWAGVHPKDVGGAPGVWGQARTLQLELAAVELRSGQFAAEAVHGRALLMQGRRVAVLRQSPGLGQACLQQGFKGSDGIVERPTSARWSRRPMVCTRGSQSGKPARTQAVPGASTAQSAAHLCMPTAAGPPSEVSWPMRTGAAGR